jgi:hypothetical protein
VTVARTDDPGVVVGPAKAAPNRLMITLVAMSATVMQVLDTTIANVALPHMQGSLGATQDQIAWVLTSYIVVAAIATPSCCSGCCKARSGRFWCRSRRRSCWMPIPEAKWPGLWAFSAPGS